VTNFIIRRLIISVFVLVFLSFAVFLLLRVTPGNAELLQAGGGMPTAEQLAALKKEKGLDKPYFPISTKLDPPFVQWNGENQYWNWAQGILTGDPGKSAFTGAPITESVIDRLPTTFELLVLTMFATIVIGVPAGVVSALYRNSPIDLNVRFLAILALSIPSFWLATMVLLIPSELWGYAPPKIGSTIAIWENPFDNLRQFVPPALVLGLASAAGIMRLTRSSLLEVLRADYVRTARAKGLRESLVVYRHALKNVLIPVVTVLGLQFTGLLGGTLFIELIFSIKGLGLYYFTAIFVKDYDVVQAMTLYVGVVVVLTQLAVDVTYAWIDPRIRYA
jgi:peptide/nickel transport system permease protein